MKPKHIKVAVTAAVLALALGGLFYSTLQEGTEYYVHVDEVMTDPGAWHGKRLQLHRYRPRYVQGWIGGRAEGASRAGRLCRRGERRDGEVPVEVRRRPIGSA